jgi:hypothetical protein
MWSWRCCLQGEQHDSFTTEDLLHIMRYKWRNELDVIVIVDVIAETRSTSIVFAINSHRRG